MRYDAGGPVHPTRAFFGTEEALGLPALYAGSKLLADNAASLPLRVYQGIPDGTHTRYRGPTIFDKPSVVGTQFDWIFACMVSMVLQGNAWGFITGRDGYGFPTGIEWIPPEDVYVHEARDQQRANPLDSRVFAYGREVAWNGPDSELFHIPAYTLPGRVEGLSAMRSFALTITAGKEAQKYGTDWYAAGGFPPGTFQNAEIEIDATAAAEIRAELVKSLRRREPLVYGRDWDYKPVTVPPSEAQFIDAMQLNATQIAAILNLPPDRVGGTRGDSLTYNTVEQSTLQVIESLRPWLRKMELAYFDLLPRNRFTKFWADALLKTDLQTRMSIYQIERNIGFRTSDEQRALEDLDPLPNGIGAEAMPLTLMNAMGTRAGAIPKSLMKSIVLEMDIATDRLIKLEKTTATQVQAPQAPQGAQPGQSAGQNAGQPPAKAPGQGGQMPQPSQNSLPQQNVPQTGQVPIGKPNAPLPLTMDPASFLASLIGVQRNTSFSYEERDWAHQLWVRIMDRAERIEQLEPEMAQPTAGSDLWAPVMHSAGVRDMVLGSPTIEDRKKHRTTVDMKPKLPVKTQVYAQLAQRFPSSALTWVNDAHWSGPTEVPMNSIDVRDRAEWNATKDQALVHEHAEKIQKRVSKGKRSLKDPIVVFEGPDGQKVIADGHHRYEGLQEAGQSTAPCYIAHVPGNTGPWSGMPEKQFGGPSGAPGGA
jgi:HK97 family phage portal protein